MSSPWIQTNGGRRFSLDHVKPELIDIEDIAHALSQLCRFNGHTREHYSVAQHCALVSQNVPPEHALVGLLHDAHEAYVGDMTSPMKVLVPGFQAVEDRVHGEVLGAYGLSLPLPADVLIADLRMVLTEGRDLLPGGILHDWNIPLEPYEFTVQPLDSHKAKALFLKRFRDATAGVR